MSTCTFLLQPFPFQPVPQRQRRKAIVGVIDHDCLFDRFSYVGGSSHFQAMLHATHRVPRVLQWHFALEAMKHLQRFERVLLHTGPNRPLQDGVKVNEQFCPEHPVDLVLAYAIAAHQPLNCGRLVRREMINVHRRMTRPSIHHRFHKPLKCRFFIGRGERPAAVVFCLSFSIRQDKPKQILPPAQPNERITL